MTAAKTAAQRQAERKGRELAAGRVQWKRWVHPDDVPALAAHADKLQRKRQSRQNRSRIMAQNSGANHPPPRALAHPWRVPDEP